MVMVVRSIGIVFVVTILSMMAGCQKKAGSITCKSDVDCRVDATGKELAGVCYMGKCEECAVDTDCSDLKQCLKNRCVSACQADADCGSNERCQNNFCIAQGSEGFGEGKDAWVQGECKDIKVHFDFDRYNIKPEYNDRLANVAKCLENNPAATMRIEGHADEQGTPSYNIVLGQKRADSAKSYLKTAWGIAAERIKTISYGQERPAVNESTEYAYSQNRRAEFTLEQN